ncbi:efflux RND transporter permease subunit [Halovibrio salipaludis]|uniref:efflux RND transporter permease subunit n=1 Tax=Halovibrio salipaludis TaxID=2032626 RepID=UPI0018E975FB|nr:MMPL family transporter [Halovibrio salipaludis]
MGNRLFHLYDRTVLSHPVLTLLLVLVAAVIAGLRLDQFQLDASPDTLVMEGDESFEYYQQTYERFETTDDFLVVSYQPEDELFSDSVINRLTELRDDLIDVDGIDESNSILNVPLLHSPDITLMTVSKHMKTLEGNDVPLDTARKALMENPLYQNMLISNDGTTTAIQLLLPSNERYYELRDRRDELEQKQREEGLSGAEEGELAQVRAEYRERKEAVSAQQDRIIRDVRGVLANYGDQARIHLGGVPMIVADMMAFVESDLVTFGLGVLAFIILMLGIIFRQPRWVLLPLACCALTVWITLGFLGWVHWPVTVISSNFVSLLLIITMSLTIHLIVRHREYQQLQPDADRYQLVSETVSAMGRPCFYMVLTTVVAFGSLFFSDIRPVIDFGLMMTVGILIGYAVVFLVLPAVLMLMPRAAQPSGALHRTPITEYLARITDNYRGTIVTVSAALAVVCAVGVSWLSVENRFIDYFKSDTEIHQGMTVIDQKLGGTTPLDVIISLEEDDGELSKDCDPFVDPDCEPQEQIDSFFSTDGAQLVKNIHDYLDEQPQTGKVISLATTIRLAERVNQGELNPLQLGLMGRAFPEDLQGLLLDPYVNEETRQARFSIRLLETSPKLDRDALFERIRADLTREMGLKDDQVNLTGMAVLYNNMLQSLFSSQIKTLGAVFVAIMAMFLVLFRSLRVAVVAIVPNLLAAGTVLGIMGLMGVPLDMMTITIAAITVGIAVDDTIHYIYRFREEIRRDGDYQAAMHRSHQTIGRAMLYTSLTIIVGFSILALSNFIPTIYFGVFTALAMAIALLGALTLLPRLILMAKPFGPDRGTTTPGEDH